MKYCCESFQKCCEFGHFYDYKGMWFMTLVYDKPENNVNGDVWPFSHCPFCGAKI